MDHFQFTHIERVFKYEFAHGPTGLKSYKRQKTVNTMYVYALFNYCTVHRQYSL